MGYPQKYIGKYLTLKEVSTDTFEVITQVVKKIKQPNQAREEYILRAKS
jgi:hypothetical protein